MVAKDGWQRYLDAGIAFTSLTRAKAEQLVQDLVESGEFQSGDARARVEDLIERSRKSREVLVAQVRREVTHQMEGMGITSLEDLAHQVATLLGRTAEAGKAATGGAKAAAKKAPAKKTAATKAPANKTGAKKAAAKKAPAKKTAATKAAAKKAPAKKAPAKKAPVTTSAANASAATAPPASPGSTG